MKVRSVENLKGAKALEKKKKSVPEITNLTFG